MTISQTLIDKVAESQFQGLPDWQVADVLNATDSLLPSVKKDVSTEDAKEILLGNGDWAAVVLTANNNSAPDQIKGACIVLRDTILHTVVVRTTVPDILLQTQTVLAALVSASVITQASQNALLALTERPVSWAEHNNLFPVTARDVGLARGGVA